MSVIFCSLLAVFRRGDWANFDKYYPTLLFFTVGNLTYEYIAHSNFHLWKLRGFGIIPEQTVDFIYVLFIVLPAILVYLSGYPDDPKRRIFHIIKWILIFTAVEWVGGQYFDVISYHHGWSIWWSLMFNFIMFPMMRLHYLYYKRALALSVPITFFFLFWFKYI